jgi:uncharacterized protein (TIGR03086 family)
VALPIGTVTREFVLYQQISEFAVHAWDLAVATRQSANLDEEVAEAALAWATTALKPQFRGSEEDGRAFGPQVAAPASCSAPQRLAAFFGRAPEWSDGSIMYPMPTKTTDLPQ